MNGYATPGGADPSSCAGSATRAALTSAGSPILAVLWADLASDGVLAACTGTATSLLTWGHSDYGDTGFVDATVQASNASPSAPQFKSTAYFYATWTSMRYASLSATTCSRSTASLVLATSKVTGETYAILQYSALPPPPSGSVPIVGFRGEFGALDVFSDSAPAKAVSELLYGSTEGSPAGTRVYRVDGLPPGGKPIFYPTYTSITGNTKLPTGDDVYKVVDLPCR